MINKSIMSKIDNLINHKYWTNYLGLARTLLGFATLLTLLSNSQNTLFRFGIKDENNIKCSGTNNFSIFCIVNNLDIAIIVSCFILFFVIIGIYPRLTAIFHWWITYSFATSSYAVDGGDQIASILTLILIPLCLFDKRKWHWQKDLYFHSYYEKVIAFFSYLLICLQVFVIYFHAATGKFAVGEWVNGTALYYWFYNSFFGLKDNLKPFFNIILKSPILITLSTWSVLILELILAFGIFYRGRKIRFFMCFLGILFHFFIALVHGLISFFLIMSGALIIYFLAKDYNFKKISDVKK